MRTPEHAGLAGLTIIAVLALSPRPTIAQQAPAVAPAGKASPAAATEPAVATPAAPNPAGTPPAHDRAAEPSLDAGASRTLNGHRFMPSAAVSQPFTNTSFGSFLIVGLGNTTGTLQVGDKTYSGTFDYAGAGGALSYEQAFLDYFSARLAISELVFSGINGSSALVVGTEVQIGGSVGVTASLPIGDSLRVGLLLDASVQPNIAITIGSGISNIINSCTGSPPTCNVDAGEIFGVSKVFQLQPAVSASWAPLRPLGVTGTVAYVYASSSDKLDLTSSAISLGSAVDFDFLAISPVPIGVMVQFNWTAPIGGSGLLQHVSDLGGGIFYTGRKDLSAGIQIIKRRFAVTPDVDVSWGTTLASIGLRYYW